MALPPLRVRLILRQADHPSTHDILDRLPKALNMAPPPVETGVIQDAGLEKVEYAMWEHPDPVGAVTAALDDIDPDWREYLEMRATT
jgi:hypothetical protein